MMVNEDALPRCKALLPAVVCAALLSSCRGCAPPPSKTADSGRRDTSLSANEVLPVDERIVLSDGTEDVKNQYAFTAMVNVSTKTGETIKCTGVFVSPRLVLTAGHCVCVRHPFTSTEKEAKFIIDNASCADEATITTIIYRPQEDFKGPHSIEAGTYQGKASPHPSMRVLLDTHSTVISSNADLAVVLLGKPAKDLPLPIALAGTEVETGEVILMAGYGFDGNTDLIHGVRRFGRKRIIKTPESGGDTVLLEAYGGEFTSGSGEPCMLKKKDGVSLIGISSKGSGVIPAFTSLSPHRDWLDAEIQRAQRE